MFRSAYHIPGILLLLLILPIFSRSFHHHQSPLSVDSATSVVDKPIKINVFPAVNKKSGIARVYIKTTRIGNRTIVLPMLFGTGSAGVTINALRIFPSDIVDTSGFKFKEGKDTINYAGIIITRLTVQKSYGAAGKALSGMTGNIGYTNLTVGDQAGAVKLKGIPILFYYKRWSLSEKVEMSQGPSVFGVDPAYDHISEAGNPSKKYPLISPFKYLSYQNDVIAGYELAKMTLTGCNINAQGDCIPQQLTIGLTHQSESQYSLNILDKQRPQLDAAQSNKRYSYYPTFYPTLGNCLIKPGPEALTYRVLFDTGNPGVVISHARDTTDHVKSGEIELTSPLKNT